MRRELLRAGDLGTPPDAGAANAAAVARLTAVWALAESALGGILHALRVPLMGLVMAGTAVLLISLIAHFARHPREILRATLLVLVVKAIGSPHTPLVGYLAVAFQGGFAYLVYSLRRPGRLSTGAFALGALLETALQRLLTLALFFGATLWEAVDEWGTWILERYFPAYVDAEFSLAASLVAVYVLLYAAGGLAVGYVAARLPGRIAAERARLGPLVLAQAYPPDDRGQETGEEAGVQAGHRASAKPATRPSRHARHTRLALTWLALGAVLAGTIYLGGRDLGAGYSALNYLLRTAVILALYYYLVGPLLSRLVHRWLLSREREHTGELDAILRALPRLRAIATAEYRALAGQHSGLALYRRWVPRVLTLSLIA